VTGGLFDERPEFDRDQLAAVLKQHARDNILIGGSSWKYEGWLGQIYTRTNYLSRGRFSQKLFESECLREYVKVFPTVCGDFAFYQFPTDVFWQKLFSQVPAEFKFAFKIPEQITCKVFPSHTRYGPMAGLQNPAFLDFDMLNTSLLQLLEPYRDRVGVLIFEFGSFSRAAMADAQAFVQMLGPFLGRLPRSFRYAVEIRNPEFLEPAYFNCLRDHGVAHVFNAWTRMPELYEQIAISDAFTADFVVSRALLRRGRAYENAVQLFTPYTEVQDPNPLARQALRSLIEKTRKMRREAYIYVNNRLEGNAPATIMAIVE
jgi:uncharacterized protein YecE (DUF72 family)